MVGDEATADVRTQTVDDADQRGHIALLDRLGLRLEEAGTRFGLIERVHVPDDVLFEAAVEFTGQLTDGFFDDPASEVAEPFACIAHHRFPCAVIARRMQRAAVGAGNGLGEAHEQLELTVRVVRVLDRWPLRLLIEWAAAVTHHHVTMC